MEKKSTTKSVLTLFVKKMLNFLVLLQQNKKRVFLTFFCSTRSIQSQEVGGDYNQKMKPTVYFRLNLQHVGFFHDALVVFIMMGQSSDTIYIAHIFCSC